MSDQFNSFLSLLYWNSNLNLCHIYRPRKTLSHEVKKQGNIIMKIVDLWHLLPQIASPIVLPLLIMFNCCFWQYRSPFSFVLVLREETVKTGFNVQEFDQGKYPWEKMRKKLGHWESLLVAMSIWPQVKEKGKEVWVEKSLDYCTEQGMHAKAIRIPQAKAGIKGSPLSPREKTCCAQ